MAADVEDRVSEKEGWFAMQVSDPVCGRRIEIDQAVSHQDHRGWAYFFCSARCHDLFSANPNRYLGPEQHASQQEPNAQEERRAHG